MCSGGGGGCRCSFSSGCGDHALYAVWQPFKRVPFFCAECAAGTRAKPAHAHAHTHTRTCMRVHSRVRNNTPVMLAAASRPNSKKQIAGRSTQDWGTSELERVVSLAKHEVWSNWGRPCSGVGRKAPVPCAVWRTSILNRATTPPKGCCDMIHGPGFFGGEPVGEAPAVLAQHWLAIIRPVQGIMVELY